MTRLPRSSWGPTLPQCSLGSESVKSASTKGHNSTGPNRQQYSHSTHISPVPSRNKVTEILEDILTLTSTILVNMQVSVMSASRRHALNEPLSSPLCCAAQGRHHSPHSCFLCSFYKFHMSVLKEPATRIGKWKINLFSGSIHFLLPVTSGVLD